MLSKKITFDHQILEDGQIQVRRITRIMEDGQELSKTYHRHVVEPTSDLTSEDNRTKLFGGVLFTPEFIKIYKEEKAKREAEYNVQ